MGHRWHIEVPGTRLVRGGNAYEFHRHVRPDDVHHGDLADRRHGRAHDLGAGSRCSWSPRGDVHPGRRRRCSPPTPRRSSIVAARRGRAHDRAEAMAGARGGRRACRALVRTIELPTWSPTPAPPGTGTGCTTTRSTSPRSSCPRRGRRAGVRRAARRGSCSTGSGREAFLRALDFRFKALVFAGETVSARATVTGVERRRRSTVDLRVVVVDAEGVGRPGRAAPCRAVVVRDPRRRDAMTSAGVAIVGVAECDLGVTGRTIVRAADPGGDPCARRRRPRALGDVDGARHDRVWRVLARPARRPPRAAAGVDRQLGVRRRLGVRDVRRPRGAGDRGRAVRHGRHLVRVQPALGALASLGGVFEEHTPEAQFETPYGPLVPAVVLRAWPRSATCTTTSATAQRPRRGRRRGPRVGAAQPGGVPPRRRAADGRRRARGAADRLAADRRRLLPGHRRRRRGRA